MAKGDKAKQAALLARVRELETEIADLRDEISRRESEIRLCLREMDAIHYQRKRKGGSQ